MIHSDLESGPRAALFTHTSWAVTTDTLQPRGGLEPWVEHSNAIVKAPGLCGNAPNLEPL